MQRNVKLRSWYIKLGLTLFAMWLIFYQHTFRLQYYKQNNLIRYQNTKFEQNQNDEHGLNNQFNKQTMISNYKYLNDLFYSEKLISSRVLSYLIWTLVNLVFHHSREKLNYSKSIFWKINHSNIFNLKINVCLLNWFNNKMRSGFI